MRLSDFIDNFGITVHFFNFSIYNHTYFYISALSMLFLSLGCTVLLVTYTVYASKFAPMSYSLHY